MVGRHYVMADQFAAIGFDKCGKTPLTSNETPAHNGLGQKHEVRLIFRGRAGIAFSSYLKVPVNP
jgi:hypothetical protein